MLGLISPAIEVKQPARLTYREERVTHSRKDEPPKADIVYIIISDPTQHTELAEKEALEGDLNQNPLHPLLEVRDIYFGIQQPSVLRQSATSA